MSTKVIKGIAGIDMAPIPVGGGMALAADFVSVGSTYRDEAKLTEADPAEVEHYSNECDDPVEADVVGGKKEITFALTDFSPVNLQKHLGGTVTGVAPDDKWEAPAVKTITERALRVRSRNGKYMLFTRVALSGKVDYDLSPKGIAKVMVKGLILAPELAGTASMEKGTLPVV